MRQLALGQPLGDSDQAFKDWVREALRQIELASNEHSGEGAEAVSGSAGGATPLVDNGAGTTGTSTKWAHEDHVHPADVATADARAAAAITGALGTTAPLMDGTADKGSSTTKLAREDHRHPSDTSRLAVSGGQTVTGGFGITPFSAGTMGTGTFTFVPTNGNYQFAGNTGAVQIQVPPVDCAIDVLITNSATAGAITFAAGFKVNANVGEAFTTTNGHQFIVSIRRINGVSTYLVKALQ